MDRRLDRGEGRAQSHLHSLPDDEKELDMSAMARSYLFPRKVAAIGDPMVDADLLDPDGNIRHLAEYKGKWILLDFWSGGCGPCNMAAPELEKFAAAQPDSIVVVSVSTDDDRYWRQSTERLKNLRQQLETIRCAAPDSFSTMVARGCPPMW